MNLDSGDNTRNGSNSSDINRTEKNQDGRVVAKKSDNIRFKCDQCSASFTAKSNLKDHMRDHTGERPYMCHECGKRFKRKLNLKLHEVVHAKFKQFECSICSKRFKHYVVMYKHVKKDHELFSCDHCDKKFISQANLAKHQSRHSGILPFNCTHCGGKFVLENFFRRHMMEHETIEKSFLKKCEGTATNADVVDEIQNNYTGKVNDSGKNLEMHLERKLYICNQCNRQFPDAGSFYRHVKRTHFRKSVNCNICNRSISTKTHMKAHMRTHTGEKPFVCNICESTFMSSSTLKYHMTLHSSDRPNHCRTCNKHFNTSEGLVIHNRLFHSGWKPFICSLCNESFRLFTQLEFHMRIHEMQEYGSISCSPDLNQDVERHQLQMVQDPAKHTAVVQSQSNQNDVKSPSTVSNPNNYVPSLQIFQF